MVGATSMSSEDKYKLAVKKSELDRVVDSLVKEGLEEIKAGFAGYITIRYKELEKILKNSGVYLAEQSIIDALVKEGIVTVETEGRIVVCPKCKNPSIVVMYTCPSCNSVDIEPTLVMSHVVCGYTGLLVDFKKNDELVCPNCKRRLESEEDYTILGRIFYCHSCKRRFANLSVKFKCIICGEDFGPFDALMKKFYRFKVNLDKVGEYIIRRAKEIVVTEFSKEGFNVAEGGSIRGQSGISHKFDYTATLNEITIGIRFMGFGGKYEAIEAEMAGIYGLSIDLADSEVVIVTPMEISSVETESFGNVHIIVFSSLEDFSRRIRETASLILSKYRKLREADVKEGA